MQDIRDALARIDRYAERGREVFEGDELIQVWIVHHLEIIGEAVRCLSPQFRARNSSAPWGQIIGMPNILAHVYFGINHELVWSVVANDLAPLKEHVDQLLAETET